MNHRPFMPWRITLRSPDRSIKVGMVRPWPAPPQFEFQAVDFNLYRHKIAPAGNRPARRIDGGQPSAIGCSCVKPALHCRRGVMENLVHHCRFLKIPPVSKQRKKIVIMGVSPCLSMGLPRKHSKTSQKEGGQNQSRGRFRPSSLIACVEHLHWVPFTAGEYHSLEIG